MLQNLDAGGKHIQLFWNLYWEKTVTTKITNGAGQFRKLCGVCIKAVFSPDLLHLYGENILRKLGDNSWIKVGGYSKKNFGYVDDATLVSNSKEKLQHLLSIVINKAKKKASVLNIKKTECIIISKKNTTPTCKIYTHGNRIRQVECF